MSERFVYLLHFDRQVSPGHPCRHYIGSAADLAARIQAHQRGAGARLTEVARERGIRFRVARVWRGGRRLERRLKNQKNAPRLCPYCGQAVGGRLADELTPAEIAAALVAF